jgi:hypothetical protein
MALMVFLKNRGSKAKLRRFVNNKINLQCAKQQSFLIIQHLMNGKFSLLFLQGGLAQDV